MIKGVILEKFYNYGYTDSKRTLFDARKLDGRSFDLILMGDSITEGFDINRYAYTNVTYLNSGIGGDRIEYMVDRYQKDVLKYNPKKVLFMGGINDIRAIIEASNMPTTYNQKRLDDFEGVKKHILDCIFEIIKLSTETQLIVCKITKLNEAGMNNDFINVKIDEINESIARICKAEGIEVIDYNQVLMTEYNKMDMNLSNDGLHPNEYGYLKMADLIEKHIVK